MSNAVLDKRLRPAVKTQGGFATLLSSASSALPENGHFSDLFERFETRDHMELRGKCRVDSSGRFYEEIGLHKAPLI
jgi:hypothetical protein